MSIYYIPAYKSRNIVKPRHDIDPSKKNNTWCKQWAEYIYCYYLNDRGGIKFSELNRITELRQYALGRQNPNKYKDVLLGLTQIGEERQGWMNVNFNEIFSGLIKNKEI